MSASTVKATRRELRRAMGANGVGAVAEVQSNHESIANSLTNAHRRIDQLAERHETLVAAFNQLRAHVKKIY